MGRRARVLLVALAAGCERPPLGECLTAGDCALGEVCAGGTCVARCGARPDRGDGCAAERTAIAIGAACAGVSLGADWVLTAPSCELFEGWSEPFGVVASTPPRVVTIARADGMQELTAAGGVLLGRETAVAGLVGLNSVSREPEVALGAELGPAAGLVVSGRGASGLVEIDVLAVAPRSELVAALELAFDAPWVQPGSPIFRGEELVGLVGAPAAAISARAFREVLEAWLADGSYCRRTRRSVDDAGRLLLSEWVERGDRFGAGGPGFVGCVRDYDTSGDAAYVGDLGFVLPSHVEPPAEAWPEPLTHYVRREGGAIVDRTLARARPAGFLPDAEERSVGYVLRDAAPGRIELVLAEHERTGDLAPTTCPACLPLGYRVVESLGFVYAPPP